MVLVAEPRLWMYQICTEFGLFQTTSMNSSIRFSQINKEWVFKYENKWNILDNILVIKVVMNMAITCV